MKFKAITCLTADRASELKDQMLKELSKGEIYNGLSDMAARAIWMLERGYVTDPIWGLVFLVERIDDRTSD